jgi:predicted ATPase/DNA-binding CsgD family transcriptional regulator
MAAIELDRRTDNLPADVTRFIGRSRDLEQVRDALGRYRLVTLRGAGGVGKTRLALQVGAAARRSFEDGVWLVELSALRNTELLVRTVAATLGVPDQGAGDPLDLLADYLADRRLLLILDTCEHLVDGCALLSEVLLRAAPRLRILATSREPLDVMGEQALLISPLDIPADDSDASGDAVQLFLDRAEAMVPGFTLTPANAWAVARVCRQLDGIPLALELAAVRLRTMSIEQVVARIEDRFRFLGTARSSQNRHQTLRAAVDWSYELCTPQERLLWARLSVFPGDFDLEAAETICDTSVDVLGRLVDKSVVLCEQDGHRYRLLDTLREYGAEQLTEPDELSRRHGAYYLQLAGQASRFGPEQVRWLTRLQQETHNLRVAMDYCYRTAGEEDNGLRLTVLLRHYWLVRGLFTEGRRWHDLALKLDRRTRDGAWALYGAGVLAVQQGDFDAANPLLDRAGQLAAELAANDLADEDLAAQVLVGRGMALFHAGDLEGGIGWFEQALAALAKTGYAEPFALSALPRLATACFLGGEVERAIGLCEDALRLSDELGDAWNRGSALWVRGAARWASGQTELAIADTLASLAVKEELGDLHSITQSIDLLAVCLATDGEFVRAAELSGAGDALWEMLGTPAQAGPHYAEARRMGADLCRAGLGEERFEAAHRRGKSLTVAQAIALARGEIEPPEPAAANPLTKREREIAGLVSQGLGNREIAERLVLSKRTIDAHIEHIFAKLQISSRVQLAAWFSQLSS